MPKGALERLIELVPEPVVLVDVRSLAIDRANTAACDLFGVSPTGGAKLTTLIRELDLETASVEKDVPCQSLGGVPLRATVVDLQDSLFLVRFQTGEFGERALHSQRLQTLGMLAGAVAHDFNNVLAGILGHTSYLKGILPKSGNHCESLDAIEDGGKSASHLIQEILAFSRLDISQQVKPLDLSAVLRSTCKLLRGALVPRFSFEYQIPETPLWFEGVEGKVAQIIVNLVINARNASLPGSTVRVELTENLSVKVKESNDSGSIRGFACLKIIDQGKGIPKEFLERIFEPYFTTSKQGTGLGLKIVDSLVASFGGSLQIDSEPGKGTTVTVFLPLSQKSGAQEDSHKSEPVSLSGKEKVLVVDDDEGVRKVMRLSLQHFGYTVDVAESAKEAISLFDSAEPRYDLVILDMLMPEISGKDLFLMLRDKQPDLRMLLVSGYVSEKVVKSLLKQGNCAFLPKPFTVEELSESIRLLFD